MNTIARLEDARVTMERLSWLLAALVLVLVPHMLRLPLWITLLFGTMAAWRMIGVRRGWGMAPAWLRLGAAILGVIAIGAEYRALSGQEAGIGMVVVMMSLKLTETVSRRDCIVLVFIAYMLVIGDFLYSQSMFSGLYMLFVVWFITAALLNLMHPTTGIALPARARIAASLLLQALPIMVVLFVLFPRVPGPLWGLPTAQTSMTGLPDSMEPGSIAALGVSYEVAFRVEFDGAVPAPSKLYWRGLVLRHFDGRRWTTGHEPARERADFVRRGEPVDYEVVLEPHRQRWLFALDLPATIPAGATLTRAWNLYANELVRERRQYRVRSYTDFETGPELLEFEIDRSLRLPDGGNRRARELAANWRERYQDPERIIGAALAMFREQQYWYTLNPPLLGVDSVDEFLFDTRRGFCEHYAGAFAFLMRAAGIPARIVLGYQGGEYNPVGDYLIVRQSSAHAWVEVLLDDIGWLRVDPTAAVSPERIEEGIESLFELEGREAAGLRGMAALARLWLHIDDLNNRWNLFVLGYDMERQREFVARFGLREADAYKLIAALTALLGTILLLLSAWLLWQRRPGRGLDPAVRTYRRLQRLLVRAGMDPARPGEAPGCYTGRAALALPGRASLLLTFKSAYQDHRYGRDPDAAQLARMRQVIKDFNSR